MKGGNVYEFNDYIRRLGDRVSAAYPDSCPEL
jgi:hypothetical protein